MSLPLADAKARIAAERGKRVAEIAAEHAASVARVATVPPAEWDALQEAVISVLACPTVKRFPYVKIPASCINLVRFLCATADADAATEAIRAHLAPAFRFLSIVNQGYWFELSLVRLADDDDNAT